MLVVANEAHGRLDNAIATDLLTRLEEEYLVAVVSAHEPVFRAIVHDAAEVACLTVPWIPNDDANSLGVFICRGVGKNESAT